MNTTNAASGNERLKNPLITKKTIKHWVAGVLFVVTIVVFVAWGMGSDRYSGSASGGPAAVVNDVPISAVEVNRQVQNIERNMGSGLENYSEGQRRMIQQRMRQEAVQRLIQSEILYQSAVKRGVVATDGEVRDTILKFPILQENGRFQKERYQAFLEQQNYTPNSFERELRKEMVQRHLEQLFMGAVEPTREEIKFNQELSRQKVQLKFVRITDEDLKKPGFVSDGEVAGFLRDHKAEVEGYYKSNPVEFTEPEKVQARHILLKVDGQHSEADVMKKAVDLRKQATPQNFAKLATQYSDDPGSKTKGGELGEFERGRMDPAFEEAAFTTKPGEISAPIKSPYGMHIIYVEKKIPGHVRPLSEVQTELARKLLYDKKSGEIVNNLKALLQKGDKKAIDAIIGKAGLKWQDSGEFNLAAANVPKLGESEEVISAVMKHGQTPGLIPDLVNAPGSHLVLDLTSWKEGPAASDEKSEATTSRMLAYRDFNDLFENWFRNVQASAKVQQNTRAER